MYFLGDLINKNRDWLITRAIWKVRSMVFFLSNRLTNPFMFGSILNSYLSAMSGHRYQDNIVMQTRNILP